MMADSDAFAAVARRVVPDGQLVRYWPLEGGVSASMHGLEIRGADGQSRRVVVRRHDAVDWKPRANNATATEFALLQALRRVGMAVPEPCLLDESRKIWPTPYFVMAFVDGTTAVDSAALPEALRHMAVYLAQLHALDIERTALPALPAREDPREAIQEYLPSNAIAEQWRAALASQAASANPPSLLHGDFWPANVLWQHDRIAAVVDWEDAALGDPLSDLAACRVELLCAYDEAAMDAFTAHYLALASVDLAGLPLWELYVSSAAVATMADWGLDPAVEARRRRRTTWFMERAGRALLAQAG